jgi:hypothetical protein
MKTLYSVCIQGTLPVTASVTIQADSEYEASCLAHRIAESQRPGVKTRLLELEVYPPDFLRFDGVAEITPIHSGDAGGKVWDREKIEEVLGKAAV